MDNNMMSSILANVSRCSACGVQNPREATTCGSCGGPLQTEDAAFSVVSKIGLEAEPGQTSAAKAKFDPSAIPLEESPNYILLKKAASGARDGSITMEEYGTIVRKLRNLHAIGLKIFDSDVAKRVTAKFSDEQNEAKEEMKLGFQEIHDGTARMETYLTSHDLTDVFAGATLAESGYQHVQHAQERAVELDPNFQSAEPE